ncbi:hypothetical protein BC628DRAFT_1186176 [Trametes gibbosa]|nr:hypothetical protein BC628DRAFT_1186176 [Trametes gibbosa]
MARDETSYGLGAPLRLTDREHVLELTTLDQPARAESGRDTCCQSTSTAPLIVRTHTRTCIRTSPHILHAGTSGQRQMHALRRDVDDLVVVEVSHLSPSPEPPPPRCRCEYASVYVTFSGIAHRLPSPSASLALVLDQPTRNYPSRRGRIAMTNDAVHPRKLWRPPQQILTSAPPDRRRSL